MNESTSTSWKDEDILMNAFFDERIKTSVIRDFFQKSIDDFSFIKSTVRSIADEWEHWENSKNCSSDWRKRSFFSLFCSRSFFFFFRSCSNAVRRAISIFSKFRLFRSSFCVVDWFFCNWRTRSFFSRRTRFFFSRRTRFFFSRRARFFFRRRALST